MQHTIQGSSLGDILERVLDKGIVIAGDISISIAEIELLRIRVRLLVASVDKAMEIGINWWESDPFLARRARTLEEENKELIDRLRRLETVLRDRYPETASLLAATTPNPGAPRVPDRP
ncbi:MAG: gas vesicle protein [Bacteroidota bacterium]